MEAAHTVNLLILISSSLDRTPLKCFFKNMNDHINRNGQLAIVNLEQAIFEGLVNITEEAATQMVLRSRFDVSKWRTAEGAEASCRRAGE